MSKKGYYGYRSYNEWNQSLWINNDEGLYSIAQEYVEMYGARKAPEMILETLEEMGSARTPDGVRWTKTGVRAAIRGINS